MRVTLIGTGLMGHPLGERLLDRGFELTVWNRTREKTRPLAERGAAVAASPGEAIGASPGALLMLRDAAAVRAVLFDGGADLAGHTIVQMSTIGPEESAEIARRVEAQGGEYVEAPVLGSVSHAREGKLQVMVGCTAEQLERWRELLSALGTLLHVGGVGAAATLKLALNQLIACQAAAFSLSLGMVRRRGVDVDQFMAILRQSAIYAPAFDTRLERFLERNYEHPTFTTELLLKDVGLARDAAAQLGLSTVVLDGVRAAVERAVAAGHAADDYGSVYEAIDPA